MKDQGVRVTMWQAEWTVGWGREGAWPRLGGCTAGEEARSYISSWAIVAIGALMSVLGSHGGGDRC